MPRKTKRTHLEDSYVTAALTTCLDALADVEDNERIGCDDAADDAMVDACLLVETIPVVQNQRYLSSRLPVSRAGHSTSIYARLQAHERSGDFSRFRQLVRMEPAAFHRIVSLLKPHSSFQKTRGRPTSVEEQVAVALFRMGHDGNGASTSNLAEFCGFAEGSIVNFTRRTVQALCALEQDVLCWASEAEKRQSKDWVEDRCKVPEWRNGFASVDGVHILCAWAPGLDGGDSFMNRKRRFSFNIQLVTLVHSLRIINYVVGHRGASQDSRAWACSSIVHAPARYLREDEWIWADMGYPYAPYLVSPYQHLAASKSLDFRRFNYNLSNIRVRSEHAMAYLKGRFPMLKGYRGLLATKEAEEYAQDVIVASLVAHNLAMAFDDAARFKLYTKAGLERFLDTDDLDWARVTPQETDEEAAAEETSLARHRTWLAQQRLEATTMTSSQRDDIRIDAAKERRESLHHQLNVARAFTFEDTTWRSRQKELTAAQMDQLERRRLERTM